MAWYKSQLPATHIKKSDFCASHLVCAFLLSFVYRKSNISLTFHVDDFDDYLGNLKLKGIIPIQKMEDNEGEFTFFNDPENYKIGIWGT